MTTTQTIEMKYVVNGGPAMQELARLQAQEDMLGAASGKMAQGLAAAERAMSAMQAGAKNLQQKLAPAAGAINGMTAALGASAGEAGKLVAGVGQLASAFATGGPYAAGLAAVTIGVQTLTKSWEDEIAAQDKALAAANAGTDRAAALRRKVDAEITALRTKANGPESGAQASARVGNEIADVEQRINGILQQRKQVEKELLGRDGYQERIDALNAEKAILEGVVRQLRVKQGLEFAAAAAGNKPPASTRTGATTATGDRTDPLAGAFSIARLKEQALADEQENAVALAESFNAIQKVAQDKSLEMAEAWAKSMAAISEKEMDFNKKAAEERKVLAETAKSDAESDARVYAGLATTTAAIIADGVVAGAQGQKDALANTIAALSKEAGGFITLEGGKVLAAGIGGALLGNPGAPLQIAGGAALVAAGAAVTAGGPAAVQALLGGGAGGAGGGRGGAGPPPRTTGASRAPSTSEAPTTQIVNITYSGATGATADETARAVADTNKRNKRNGVR